MGPNDIETLPVKENLGIGRELDLNPACTQGASHGKDVRLDATDQPIEDL